MAHAAKPPRRKPGPIVRLPDRIKYTTVLTVGRRDALERYALAHGVSAAEAVRRAVDLLTGSGGPGREPEGRP